MIFWFDIELIFVCRIIPRDRGPFRNFNRIAPVLNRWQQPTVLVSMADNKMNTDLTTDNVNSVRLNAGGNQPAKHESASADLLTNISLLRYLSEKTTPPRGSLSTILSLSSPPKPPKKKNRHFSDDLFFRKTTPNSKTIVDQFFSTLDGTLENHEFKSPNEIFSLFEREYYMSIINAGFSYQPYMTHTYSDSVDLGYKTIINREKFYCDFDQVDLISIGDLKEHRTLHQQTWRKDHPHMLNNHLGHLAETLTIALKTYQKGVFGIQYRLETIAPNNAILIYNKYSAPRVQFQMRPELGNFNPLSFVPGLSHLQDLCTSIQEDVLPQVEQSSNTLSSILNNVTEKLSGKDLPNVKNEAESFITKIIDSIGLKLTKGALKVTSFALFASALLDYSNNWSNHSGTFLILSIVVLLIIWSDELSMILTGISTLLGKIKLGKGVQLQSGETFDVLGTGLISLLMGLSIKNEKPGKIPDNILQKLGSFDRTKKAISDFFRFFIDIICLIADKVHLGEYLPTNFRYAYIQEDSIVELSSKIDKMISDLNQSDLIMSYENYDLLKTYDKEVENHLLELPRIPSNNGLITILTDQRKNVKNLLKKFEERFVKNIRQEPVCVMLRGSPGTLKSSVLQHLSFAGVINSVPKNLLEHAKKNTAYYMYNRTPEQKYWDGYRQGCSIVTYCDDFGQVRDIAGEPDAEAMAVIRMVNSLEAQLHMADIGGKGNTRFDSKFVIMTTNATSFKFESVISTLAVCRRFDFTYTVVPKPEYVKDSDKQNDLMNRSIDMNKLPMGQMDVTSVHPRYLDFHGFSYVTGKHTGEVLSYEEVEARMLNKEREKNKWFVQNELELKKTAERHASRREEVQMDDLEDISSQGSTLTAEEIDADDLEAISTALQVIEVIETQELEILPSVPGTLEEKLYYSRDKRSPIRNYVDKCVELLKLNPEFTDYKKCILVTLLFSNDVTDFVKAINTRCEKFLLGLMIKKRWEFPIGYPKVKGKLTLFCDKIKEWFKTAFDFCFTNIVSYYREFVAWTQKGNNIYILVGSVTALSLFVGTVCSWIGFSNKKDDTEPNIESTKANTVVVLEKGDYHLRSRQTFKVVQSVETPSGNQYIPVQGQMGSIKDKSGYDQVLSKLHTNMYTFNRLKEDGPVRIGFITFIEGRTCVMNYHYITYYEKLLKEGAINPKALFEITRATKGDSGLRCYKYTIEEFISQFKTNDVLKEIDLCFAYLDKVTAHSSIVKLFPTVEEQKKVKADFGMLLSKENREVRQASFIVQSGKNIEEQVTKIPYHNTYEYLGYTDLGDCGSWLELLDRTSRAKLFGIHLAGDPDTGYGYSIPVNQEVLEMGLNLCGKRIIYDWPVEVQTQMGEQFLDKYDIIARTSLPNTTVGKTNLVKTPVFGAWSKPTTIPCKLTKFIGKDGDVIDPYSQNIIKFCKPDIFIPSVLMKSLGDSLYDFLKKNSSPFEGRILSFEEAISGIADDEFYSGINVSTSPGYPLNMDKSNKEPGKKKWFTVNEDGTYDLSKETCAELKKEVMGVIEKLKKGERTQFIFADNLKDETRPFEKVMSGKTRIFSSCPLVYFIIVRMYFGIYQSWYMRNHTNNGSALGVNPYSPMWDRLARKFKQFLENDNDVGVGAGDYAAFDGSQLTQQQNEVLRVINKIYDDDHSFIRQMLWLEVTSSIHIKDDIIYEWQGSLPSGHPLTPIINCMYNHLNLRYCWYRANKNDLASLWEFDRFVYVIVLGDDNAFSVHKSARSVFNEITIGGFMKEIGMTYTTELKVQADIPLRKITDVSFLKRQFRYEPIRALYLAPLELSVILETAYWCNKNPNLYSITQDLVQNSIDELSLHGEEVFNNNVKKIIRGLEKRMGVNPSRTSFAVCLSKVCQLEAFF